MSNLRARTGASFSPPLAKSRHASGEAMDSSNYLLGLFVIITGLAIADIVVSLHGVLLNRRIVKWDWLAILAAAFVFLAVVVSWGIAFRAWHQPDVNPTIWAFLVTLSQIIPLYLAARASLPDAVAADGVDLADHYAHVSRYFWSAIAVSYGLYLVAVIATRPLSDEVLRERWNGTVQLILMLVLIAFPQRRVHAIVVPLIMVLFVFDHLTGRLLG